MEAPTKIKIEALFAYGEICTHGRKTEVDEQKNRAEIEKERKLVNERKAWETTVLCFGSPSEGLQKLIAKGILVEDLREKVRNIETSVKELCEEKIRIISLAATGFNKDPMEREFDVRVGIEATQFEAIAMKYLTSTGGGRGSKTKKSL